MCYLVSTVNRLKTDIGLIPNFLPLSQPPRCAKSTTWCLVCTNLIGKIEFHLKDDVEIIDKEYDEKVTFTYLCKEPIDTKIQEITNGQYKPEYIETLEVEVTI